MKIRGIKVYTPVEVAEIFDKSATFVKKRAAAGDWPAFKVGQEWRFTEEDVEAITRIGRREAATGTAPVLMRSQRRRRRAAS